MLITADRGDGSTDNSEISRRYCRNSTTVAPAPPSFCGGSLTLSTCGWLPRYVRKALAQNAHAHTMHNAHAWHSLQKCLVQKFLHCVRRLFHRTADHVDLGRCLNSFPSVPVLSVQRNPNALAARGRDRSHLPPTVCRRSHQPQQCRCGEFAFSAALRILQNSHHRPAAPPSRFSLTSAVLPCHPRLRCAQCAAARWDRPGPRRFDVQPPWHPLARGIRAAILPALAPPASLLFSEQLLSSIPRSTSRTCASKAFSRDDSFPSISCTLRCCSWRPSRSSRWRSLAISCSRRCSCARSVFTASRSACSRSRNRPISTAWLAQPLLCICQNDRIHSQPLRNVDSRGHPWNPDTNVIGWRERFLFKSSRRILHTGVFAAYTFSRSVMGGNQTPSEPRGKMRRNRSRQRRALFRVGCRTNSSSNTSELAVASLIFHSIA